MEAQKFIIRYGYNDFVFEGSVLELANIVRALEKLTPVFFDSNTTGFEETVFRKKLLIYSARKKAEVDTNNPIYVIDI